jgi:hypothetical protein
MHHGHHTLRNGVCKPHHRHRELWCVCSCVHRGADMHRGGVRRDHMPSRNRALRNHLHQHHLGRGQLWCVCACVYRRTNVFRRNVHRRNVVPHGNRRVRNHLRHA